MKNTHIFPDNLVLEDDLLSLDFANTVSWRLRYEPEERLRDYAALVKWSQQIGLLSKAKENRLLREAESRPDEAALVLNRAIDLRESFYRIIVETIHGNQLEAEDLSLLNKELAEMLGRTVMVKTGDGFNWAWKDAEDALDQMLWPIIRSAAELLTSPELNRIGICQGEGCGWLFFDKSKNRSRKWCDMSDCGNRAKAKRFYMRKKEPAET